MNIATIRLDIVSAESEIFSGLAKMIFVTGDLGELGIAPGHAPLITSLKPGLVRARLDAEKEEIFYFNGGMLEIQPTIITILADTVVRAHDLDEAAALEAKARAERMLAEKLTEVDFAKATAELSEAIAQLRALQQLKKKLK